MPARTSNLACAVTSLLLIGSASACKKSDHFIDVNNDPSKRAGSGGGGGSGEEAGADAAGGGGGSGGRGVQDPDAAVSGEGGSAAGASGNPANDGDDAGTMPADRSCEAAAEVAGFSVPVMASDESGFAVTAGLTGFGVTFNGMDCERRGALNAMPVGTLGPYKSPVKLFGECTDRFQDATLLHVSDGFRLVWVDNSAGSAELQTTLLSETLALPAELTRTRLTTNSNVLELRPVMSTIGGAAYLAWIAADDPQREVDLLRLDQAEPQVVLSTDRGYHPTRLALGQLGKDHGALAFVDEQGKRGIWLVPIDENGQAAAEPTLLSEAVDTGNTVDLATREADGGAVVYSIDVDQTQPEVRFRRLSTLGGFLGDEIKIASAPVKARDASVTRLGDGYVVAYREISSTDPKRAEIRLALITKEGTVMRDAVGRPITYLAGEASANGGRISARISIDGQLLLGFLDSDDSGVKFRMLRKRLDCAL